MNDHDPAPHHAQAHEPEPLDAFDRAWINTLSEQDRGLSDTSELFVQRVLAAHAASTPQGHATQTKPAVAGRVGPRLVRYAVAAALALAAIACWYVLSQGAGGTSPPHDQNIVEHNAEPDGVPQPKGPNTVAPGDRPEKVNLGELIAQAQGAATGPADTLTSAIRGSANPPALHDLLDWIDSPVPDLKTLLAPIDATEQHSRA